jgi:hypothetical protein
MANATRTGGKTATKTPELARLKGRRMAARMLYEIERVQAHEASISGMDPYSLYAEYRYKGEPQNNIVLRYLQRAAAQGDECVAGFCSALSDYCGAAEACGTPDPVIYNAPDSAINDGDPPTREQILREKREANRPGTSLH